MREKQKQQQQLRFAALLLSLLFAPNEVKAITNQAQVFALQNLYTSLNFSKMLGGWSSNGMDPCSHTWLGVQCNGPDVTEIHLSGLGLSGNLGYRLDQLTSLRILDLSHNRISGDLPYQLPPNVEQLNLGSNNFTGTLPYSLSGMTHLSTLNISNNHLSAGISDIFGQLNDLSVLDLSFNNLTGTLPQSFSSLSKLAILHLQHNILNGDLNLLGNLSLKDLNVESNHFTGCIPSPFGSISKLKDGGNNFCTSSVPSHAPLLPDVPPPPIPTQETALGPSNSTLNQQSSPSIATPMSHDKHRVLNGGAIAAIAIASAIAFGVSAIILIISCMKSREDIHDEEKSEPVALAVRTFTSPLSRVTLSKDDSKPSAEDVPLKPPPSDLSKVASGRILATRSFEKRITAPIAAKAYSVADLQLATKSFSQENLIGEGSLGTVYKAELPDRKIVAVKKIQHVWSSCVKESDVMQNISDIASLRHANIVELVGYCVDHGQFLLVYDYFGKGTLHDILHSADEASEELTWNVRVKIALGVAKALEYLHEICSPPIIHMNFKSSNILLDDELNPHLSDTGIAVSSSSSYEKQVSFQRSESFSYNAPEHAILGSYTSKSDVYSFGVVMLELLSGRKPFDSLRPRGEKSLVRWATPKLHDIDALTGMVDAALGGLYPVKSISRFADIIALCVQPEPEFRPLMSEVVQSLVRLMQRAALTSKRRPSSLLAAAADDKGEDYDLF